MQSIYHLTGVQFDSKPLDQILSLLLPPSPSLCMNPHTWKRCYQNIVLGESQRVRARVHFISLPEREASVRLSRDDVLILQSFSANHFQKVAEKQKPTPANAGLRRRRAARAVKTGTKKKHKIKHTLKHCDITLGFLVLILNSATLNTKTRLV